MEGIFRNGLKVVTEMGRHESRGVFALKLRRMSTTASSKLTNNTFLRSTLEPVHSSVALRKPSFGYNEKRCFSTSDWMSMKIYTKTGDKGTTALFTGERRAKNDKFFDALGATDELSSHIALCREFAIDNGHSYEERLRRIQCLLQDIASVVATPKSSAREAHLKRVQFSAKHIEELEEWIDEYTEQLPELTNFILPGGGKASASIHIARTVCRRAERAIAPLVAEEQIDKEALIYMNRLSDFLFTLARFAAKLDNQEETIYIKEDPVS